MRSSYQIARSLSLGYRHRLLRAALGKSSLRHVHLSIHSFIHRSTSSSSSSSSSSSPCAATSIDQWITNCLCSTSCGPRCDRPGIAIAIAIVAFSTLWIAISGFRSFAFVSSRDDGPVEDQVAMSSEASPTSPVTEMFSRSGK